MVFEVLAWGSRVYSGILRGCLKFWYWGSESWVLGLRLLGQFRVEGIEE